MVPNTNRPDWKSAKERTAFRRSVCAKGDSVHKRRGGWQRFVRNRLARKFRPRGNRRSTYDTGVISSLRNRPASNHFEAPAHRIERLFAAEIAGTLEPLRSVYRALCPPVRVGTALG